ncbi:MAG TPA: RNA methyltransferase [Blastocatellia bacterium]|nr:RNA methyltransferase [Blastocatellia bacterium]
MLITSPVNPQLKFARRVREGKEADAIFVEGERLCEELLKSGLPLIVAFHTPDPTPRAAAVIAELWQRQCHVYETATEAFAVVSDTVNPQGIIIIAARPVWQMETVLHPNNLACANLLLAFDSVQDPGNVGTILRTAEAAGVQGIVALKGTVDCFAPKTLRSAMGAAFRLPILTEVEPEELRARCQAAKITLVATTVRASLIYSDYDWQQPTMLLFGNEANGVRPQLLEQCDVQMRIPLQPPVESINVSAAAAAILFEAARQRRQSFVP